MYVIDVIRVSDIKSDFKIKGFFKTKVEVFYKGPNGEDLNLTEPAKKAYVNYSDAKYQLRQFDNIDKNLHELSILLSRLIEKKDPTNAINYDLDHPIWKAFQKLLEKNGEFAKAVSELKELLDPKISTHTGEVNPKEVNPPGRGFKMA